MDTSKLFRVGDRIQVIVSVWGLHKMNERATLINIIDDRYLFLFDNCKGCDVFNGIASCVYCTVDQTTGCVTLIHRPSPKIISTDRFLNLLR